MLMRREGGRWSETTSCHMIPDNSIQFNPDCGFTICFTICLCISPDLDGNRGTKNGTLCPDVSFRWVSWVVKSRLTTSQTSTFSPSATQSHPEKPRENKPSTSACTCPLHSLHRYTRRRGAASSLLSSTIDLEPENRLPPTTAIQNKRGIRCWAGEALPLRSHTQSLLSGVPPQRSKSQTSRKPGLLYDPSSSTCRTSLANPKLCKNCGASGCEFKCACKQGYYCSRKCQKKDWHIHKQECAMVHSGNVREARKEHGKDDVHVAEARLEAGYALLHQGRYKEAERCFMEARRIYTAARGAEDYDVGRACDGLGTTYSRSGRYEEGIGLLKKALRIYRSTEGGRSLEAGVCLSVIGDALMDQDKLDEALERLEQALDICTEAGGTRHESVSSVLTNMGNCLQQMGRFDEALAKHKRALVIDRIIDGDGSESVAASLNNIGNVFSRKGMLAEARAKYEEDLEITRRLRGEKHPDVATALYNIANIMRRQRQLDGALEMHEKALKIRRRALGEDHVDVAHSLESIGAVYADQGKHVEALEMHGKAIAICDRALGVDSRDSARVHYYMALAKKKSGDVAGALEDARESVRIYTKLGVTDSTSQDAADLLKELEGVE